MSKTNTDSLNQYQKYTNREQLALEEKSKVQYNGVIQKMTGRDVKKHYLKHLCVHIDQLIKENNGKVVKILEVGCGNCINLTMLSNIYGSKIELTGLDISEKRIQVAKEFYPEELKNINLFATSITAKTHFKSNEFDLVYSMFCIEQIAFETKLAVTEMHRLTSNLLIFIEPVIENANFLQKLYIINSDICRILLKSIQELGYKIKENRVLDIHANPMNQSSMIVVKKM
jgi:2-polyprenyl-3-methyl-5-hydroxy-6-metoxy-1,4-benzoquinol methylase